MMGCPFSGGAGLDDDEGKRSIEEWVDDIVGEIHEAASDNELSTGEVLIQVALNLMDIPQASAEERAKAIDQFIAVIREKAEASA